MTTTTYEYPDWANDEIRRCIREMLPKGTPLKRATQQEDFGGIDARWIVNQHLPLQLRSRFDRPVTAPDEDITFRLTEPAMMAAGTYAPLALFVWFRKHQIVAGHLVDIERMNERVNPPLRARVAIVNHDETAFITVGIGELHDARALLRHYDGRHWATQILNGETRLLELLARPWSQSA